MSVFLFSFLLLLSRTFGLYTSSDDVIELNDNTFDQVTSSSELWLVEFYAPWCGHCKKLAPEWKRAATVLKGIVKVAAVNSDEFKSLASKYSVKGYPTIMIFGENKENPTTYNGGRQADAIIKDAMMHLNKIVDSRTGGGYSSSGGSKSDSDVVELTEANFDKTVLQSDEPWLVEFFAPWCGHCKALKPHWEKVATEMKGKVKVGAVDCTVHERLAAKYGIKGYPTIKFFPSGSKAGDPIDYNGARTADDIASWAGNQAEATLPAPEVREITSNVVLRNACDQHQLCIISVLPQLYDCQSECRNKYLDILKTEAELFKRHKWAWLWTEALKHEKLETAVDVGGFGYPAMVAVHAKKEKRATLHGSFSQTGVHDFLRTMSLGGAELQLFPQPSLPNVETVEPWDGKDAEEIAEEEVDLTDLGIKTEL